MAKSYNSMAMMLDGTVNTRGFTTTGEGLELGEITIMYMGESSRYFKVMSIEKETNFCITKEITKEEYEG